MSFLEDLKPDPKAKRTLARLGDLARNLHRYRSDVRTIAAAQRRNLGFCQLSRRELDALVQIAVRKFTPDQQALVEETPKMAQVILWMSKKLQAQDNPKKDPAVALLQMRGTAARNMMQWLIDNPKWTEAETSLLMSDLYYSTARSDDKDYRSLIPFITSLPGTTIRTTPLYSEAVRH